MHCRPQLAQQASEEYDEDEVVNRSSTAGGSEASGWVSLQLCTPEGEHEPASGSGREGGAPCEHAAPSLGECG